MMDAPVPEDDVDRVAALRRYCVLDTLAEPAFDRLTQIAQHIFGTPTVLISLVDSERQWFKSRIGLDVDEMPRNTSFCGHAVFHRKSLVIPDTLADPRFANNPLVAGPPSIRFYVGEPLIDREGFALGTLCIIDYKPRLAPSPPKAAMLRSLAGAVVDAMERRLSTQELAAKTLILQTTMDSISQGISAFDADLKLIAGNRMFLELLEFPAELGTLGTDFDEFIAHNARRGEYGPGDVDQQVTARVAIARKFAPHTFERVRPDGCVIEVKGVPMPGGGFVSTYTDVTEKRRASEELQRQLDEHERMSNALAQKRQLLQTTLDSVSQGISAFDKHLKLVASNAKFLDLLALPPEFGKIGSEFSKFVTYLTRRGDYGEGHVEERVAARLAAVRESEAHYLELIRPDGRIIAINGVPVPGGGRVTTYTDITDVRRNAEELQRRLNERERIERLKNEFVSTVSHELRTPLTSIAGMLELLDAEVVGALPAEAKEMVNVAYNNSLRLIRLINDILDIEKIESGRMPFDLAPLPLAPLIEKAVAEMQSFAQGLGVRVARQFRVVEAIALVDPDRFIQVLTNLVSNAAKFSPQDETVLVTLDRSSDRLRISVADRGPGIPEVFRGRMFEKFAQADGSDSRRLAGTGLGLAIVKEIVERLDGTVSFDTEIDRGTTFHVDLPEWKAVEATSTNSQAA